MGEKSRLFGGFVLFLPVLQVQCHVTILDPAQPAEQSVK